MVLMRRERDTINIFASISRSKVIRGGKEKGTKEKEKKKERRKRKKKTK